MSNNIAIIQNSIFPELDIYLNILKILKRVLHLIKINNCILNILKSVLFNISSTS